MWFYYLFSALLFTSPYPDPEYSKTQTAIYSRIDNRDGFVIDVYTHRKVEIDPNKPIPDHREVNLEHVFCKSWGNKQNKRFISDVHNLYVVDSFTNSKRSNYPLGVVVKITWKNGDCKLGYDSRNNLVFEPPDNMKGNFARSIFYVSNFYKFSLKSQDISVLKLWNKQDPVDEDEIQRNNEINRFQCNRNVFVDNPDLVDEKF